MGAVHLKYLKNEISEELRSLCEISMQPTIITQLPILTYNALIAGTDLLKQFKVSGLL